MVPSKPSPLLTIQPWASNQPAIWGLEWSSITPDILDQNLSQITVGFWLDGQPVPLSQFYQHRYVTEDGEGFYDWYTVVSNWPKGVTTLKCVQTIASPIFDGMHNMGVGLLIQDYTVTVP